MDIENKIDAKALRFAITGRLKDGARTAAELSEMIRADLGQVKCALKVLVERGEVARRDMDAEPPLFRLVPHWQQPRRRQRQQQSRQGEEPAVEVIRTAPRIGAML